MLREELFYLTSRADAGRNRPKTDLLTPFVQNHELRQRLDAAGTYPAAREGRSPTRNHVLETGAVFRRSSAARRNSDARAAFSRHASPNLCFSTRLGALSRELLFDSADLFVALLADPVTKGS